MTQRSGCWAAEAGWGTVGSETVREADRKLNHHMATDFKIYIQTQTARQLCASTLVAVASAKPEALPSWLHLHFPFDFDFSLDQGADLSPTPLCILTPPTPTRSHPRPSQTSITEETHAEEHNQSCMFQSKYSTFKGGLLDSSR